MIVRGSPSTVGFKILSGRCAASIVEHDCAFDNVGLLRIVRRHGDAPLGEALVHRGHDRMITFKFHTESSGYALAREVVLGGTETAGDNNDVRTPDGSACNSGEMVEVIADHGLERDNDSQFVELAR